MTDHFPSSQFTNGPGFVMNPIAVEEHKRSTTSQANKDKIPAWKDHPAEFMPERWLDSDGTFNPKAGPFNTFGAGPRGCFGEYRPFHLV